MGRPDDGVRRHYGGDVRRKDPRLSEEAGREAEEGSDPRGRAGYELLVVAVVEQYGDDPEYRRRENQPCDPRNRSPF